MVFEESFLLQCRAFPEAHPCFLQLKVGQARGVACGVQFCGFWRPFSALQVPGCYEVFEYGIEGALGGLRQVCYVTEEG